MKTKVILTAVLLLTIVLGVQQQAQATKHIITQTNLTFVPSNLPNVNIGDTIRWVWTSGFHTTTSTVIPPQALPWDAVLSSSSTFFEYAVTTSGVFNYHCTPHASFGMIGSFTVNSGGGSVSISGNVFDDANGLLGSPVNTVDGTGTNASGSIFTNLVDNTNHVLASLAVSAGGTYSFSPANGVLSNTSYHLILTTSQMTAGVILTSASLPANWVSAGENLGSGAGNDGNANSILNVQVNSTSLTNANFGLDQLPSPVALNPAPQINPGGTTSVAIPATSFSGTDPESPSGFISELHLTTFPTNITSITINGTNYTSGNWPLAGLMVPTNAAGNPTQNISIDPLNQNVTVDVTFGVLDNAGKESSGTATVHIVFNEITLSGTVFDDADALIGIPANTVNGTGTNANGALYVNLVDNTNHVLGSIAVPANGAYTFNSSNGLQSNISCKIILSNSLKVVGSLLGFPSLPNNWVSTGEFLGTGPGNDGVVNSILSIPTITTSVVNANLGIEQLPTPVPVNPAAQVNPGGTTNVTISPSSFTGSDPENPAGYITQMRILTFPANISSFTIDATTYYMETWPGNGVLLSTNSNGNQTVSMSIDPLDGAIVSSIDFSVLDNAGEESLNTATLNIAFLSPFNTINGTLSYNNSGSIGMPNSTIYLRTVTDNTLVTSTTTSNTGAFSFTNVPDGNYILQASTSVFWGGVNATDALGIMKHFVGLIPLSGLRLAAANVDNNSFVNALDALVVTKRFVGLIPTFPVGDWRFNSAIVNASGSNIYTVNFQGICYGDVDGSYNSFILKTASPVNVENADTRIVRPGQEVTVPVILTENTTVGAVSLVLNLPSELGNLKNVVMAEDKGFLNYNQVDNQLKISWFSLDPLTIESGQPLMFITFTVGDNLSKGTSLNFSLADYSELADADAKPIQNVTVKIPGLVASPAASVKHIITQTGFTFVPSNLTGVLTGDTVRWIWTAGTHTTTSSNIPANAAPWDHVLSSTSTFFDYVPGLPGEYNYVCTPHASLGMIGKFTVSNSSAGINDPQLSAVNVSISPNPATDNSCTLSIPSTTDQMVIVKLMDMLGAEISVTQLSLASGMNTHTMDLSAIHTGFYFVQIWGDNSLLSAKKLIKR